MELDECSEEEDTKLSSKEKFLPTPEKKKCENSKRFSDEQVKLLESAFKRGAKLEPRMKLQLARDLGLQPRQVSIWFQNKRARWKSKHIEQEYIVLKANFDALYKQFESLKKEKQSLLEQLQTLRSLLENHNNWHNSRKDSPENGLDKGPGNGNEKHELKENNGMALNLDEEEREVEKYFRLKEEPHIFSLSEQGSSSLASPEKCRNLATVGFLDESCCPSSWWDF